MQIERLTLRNFKGVQDLTIEPNGADVDIFGDNGTGKTTIADAFSWLLFGKDSSGRADFEIKCLGQDGEAEHGLEHEVIADLEIATDDGREAFISLRKVYREKWTKHRGSAARQFTGHTTEHYIDGVPVKKAEYDSRVAEITEGGVTEGGERYPHGIKTLDTAVVFQLLTEPHHFCERLHWKERRALLLAVCGDVADGDVFASNAELIDLAGIVGDRSIEDHRKVIAAKRVEINRELERIPVRIDEVTRSHGADFAELDRVTITASLAMLRAERKTLEQKRVRIESGGEVAELTKQLLELQADDALSLLDLRAKHDGIVIELRAERAKQQDALSKAQGVTMQQQNYVVEHEREIAAIDKHRDTLRERYRAFDGRELHGDDVCVSCGQSLPREKIAAALVAFNLETAQKLEQIDLDGRMLVKSRKLFEAKIEKAKACERGSLAEEGVIATQVAEIEESRASLVDPPTETETSGPLREIKADIERLQEDAKPALEAVNLEIIVINEEVATGESALGRLDAFDKAQTRIAVLAAEERTLAAEYEQLERGLWLTDEFVRTKVRLLEEKINARFELARFRLFKPLIAGGVEECCDATFDGVPYSTNLNHGARINVGLDIIRALQKHYGFSPPVFVDRCESVTKLIPLDAQLVRLIVSADDAELRVELNERYEIVRNKDVFIQTNDRVASTT